MEQQMATPKIPPRRCGLYWPGHEVHLMRLMRYINSRQSTISGRLIEAGDSGVIVVEFDDEVRRYWNHEPKLLAHLAGRNDNRVELQESGGLLGTRIKNGYWPFNIADPDDHQECPDTPPTGTAAELLESAGGFLVSS